MVSSVSEEFITASLDANSVSVEETLVANDTLFSVNAFSTGLGAFLASVRSERFEESGTAVGNANSVFQESFRSTFSAGSSISALDAVVSAWLAFSLFIGGHVVRASGNAGRAI